MAKASSEKSRPSLFWLLAAVVVPLVGWFAKIEVRGGENLPREGAYVLAPNHHSEFDPLTVAVATWRLGRAPRFMAKESLFRVPVLGAAMKATGMVPVTRGKSGASQSMAQANDIVKNARGVIVYPEGTLTRDPDVWPMRGKSGAVRLALAGGIPLIPVAHWGEQQFMPRYGKIKLFPPRRRVTVVIGKPVDMSDFVGREHEKGVLTDATDRVMAEISGLLGQIRGETPPAERWDPTRHGQSETGRM
ncbi:1-acyl-sn-glycerol-3-phosphate acyltransferase [Microbacterium sorbitolivorans]|uniref:lysophospholipid acyltransferase family protein n=1 Tax=Microbacterium sorbitolivorans TaxID=1867410 RepID=UPI00198457A4|nr:lysophospholipid acyltransferase family protein [Microbacterium sorbitolivorans]GGF44731.1 1-acyl-sn-glycerol-3-phosphate acyltransferase [Microbacterium sorbitolivorans]